MLRAARLRISLELAIVGTIGLIATGSSFSAEKPPPKNEDVKFYVKPLAPDAASAELFEQIGVSTVGFAYRVPPEHVAVVGFTTDKKGDFIKKLCYIGSSTPFEKGAANEGTMRVTRIDPSALSENGAKSERWILKCGGMSTSKWISEFSTCGGASTGWGRVKGVSDPVVDKDYTLWEFKAYPDDLPSISDKSSVKFRFQIMFKIAKMKSGDGYNSEEFQMVPDAQ